ncbi:MAG: RagB/SusD family nutrient uptake outer membrane protein [Prevotella sp.]|nr:RagB/SusD family nutrient uptake outer membrane protein [Prevotella sp.]
MKLKYIALSLTTALALTSCESILEIDPPTDSLTADVTFSTPEGIRTAATGFYTENFLNNLMYYQGLELYVSQISDELLARSGQFADLSQNNYNSSTNYIPNLWSYPYSSIYGANDFLGHIEGSTVLPADELNKYRGEALFFRANAYFYLVNLFGDVPLLTTYDVSVTATAPRTPKAEVYQQIIADLQQAQQLLKGSGNGRTRITTDAATALLARVYLYTEQWDKAISEANKLIPTADGGQGSSYQLETADRVFLATSSEAILQSNQEGFTGTGSYVGYTRIGNLFIPNARATYANYYFCDELVADLRSEPADLRNQWIGEKAGSGGKTYYYPYKYKNMTTPSSSANYEYYVLLRLAEQYLIRAEASVHLGNMQQAVADINTIRHRAALADYAGSTSQTDLLMEIEQQRRKEFFFEGGHRWMDLNRTGRADAVYGNTSYKKVNWKSYRSLLPIPEQQIGRNRNLTQNPGY